MSTALFAWLDFLAAFVIFDWANGSFGGYGDAGQSPDGWAIPAWLALTVAFVALDIAVIQKCANRSRTTDHTT